MTEEASPARLPFQEEKPRDADGEKQREDHPSRQKKLILISGFLQPWSLIRIQKRPYLELTRARARLSRRPSSLSRARGAMSGRRQNLGDEHSFHWASSQPPRARRSTTHGQRGRGRGQDGGREDNTGEGRGAPEGPTARGGGAGDSGGRDGDGEPGARHPRARPGV